MYKGSEKDKEYKRQYKKEHSKMFAFRCFYSNDTDIIEQLEKNKPINSYIKALIRKDIEQTKDN